MDETIGDSTGFFGIVILGLMDNIRRQANRWLATLMALTGWLNVMGGESEMKNDVYEVQPVGWVSEADDRSFLDMKPELIDAMDGLRVGAHIWVFWWFDRNDDPEHRSILKVHPRGNPANPLRGVFATRSPARPNLIALTLCRIVGMEGSRIEIESIDAFPGTPILDIKPYLENRDRPQE